MQTHTPAPTMPPAASNLAAAVDRLKVRLVALVIFLACAGVLAVSAWLTPAGDQAGTGVGTHEQLGMAPCGLYAATGLPCVTCGMTTSFALAADGRLIQSFINQPAGAVLALLVAVTTVGSLFALITATPMWPLYAWMVKPKMLVLVGAMLLLAWAYKIAAVMGWIPGL